MLDNENLEKRKTQDVPAVRARPEEVMRDHPVHDECGKRCILSKNGLRGGTIRQKEKLCMLKRNRAKIIYLDLSIWK
jgi:hypothetical protein